MSPVTRGTSQASGAGRSGRLPRSTRRGQLLAAAQEVFVAHGYHAAAMDDIAERAGVSKPVLYQHFPGKLDLYLALLDTHCDALVTKVRTALSTTAEDTERVRGAMRAYFEFIDDESQAFRLVFESDLRNEARVRERVDRMERTCVEAVAEMIMSDVVVPREPAELLAAGLVGAASAAARYWLASGRVVPRQDAERLITAVTWGGIGGFPLQGEST